MDPLISICIPAYKRTDFLKRLLDSISIQTFQEFEVIITDDSPGEELAALMAAYDKKFDLKYFRNPKALGTPENWNEAIRKGSGRWIKLMHDDDWFSDAHSLQYFVDAINREHGRTLIFSAYRKVFIDEGRVEEVFVNAFRYRLLQKNPFTLIASNIIGPPSVVIHRNDHRFFYDKNLKWLVDIDFYISNLQNAKSYYIDRVLVDIGMNAEQVTKESFRINKVEIPENFYLLNKIGVVALKDIHVYDAWWRLIRNLRIRKLADIQESGYSGELPLSIKKMIGFQSRIPLACLNIGVLSKFFMALSFIIYFRDINK
ncbi:MAG: glycosyltransferase family 2 protein [Bacteroidetes bacterium]|nr:glycosyltransferase family 2 protein [Bacteroidota bacterium]